MNSPGGVEGGLDGVDGLCPALEHVLDVASVLHGDAADVVLLVDPDEEGLRSSEERGS